MSVREQLIILVIAVYCILVYHYYIILPRLRRTEICIDGLDYRVFNNEIATEKLISLSELKKQVSKNKSIKHKIVKNKKSK